MQKCFRQNYCSGVSSFVTTLAQPFFISKFSIRIMNRLLFQTECFRYKSSASDNSDSTVTECDRMYANDVYTFT